MPIGITLITIIIKFELFIVTGYNWLPSREGEGGVSYSRLYNHPNQSHLTIAGSFAVCFS